MFVRTNYTETSVMSERHVPAVSASASQRQYQARRGLALFFILLLTISTLFYWLIIVKHDELAMFFFMWIPGSAAIATRLLLREKRSSFPLHPNLPLLVRTSVTALLAPLIIGLFAYGLAWKTGLSSTATFQPSTNIAAGLQVLGAHPSLLTLAGYLLLIASGEILSATGEELGWRGYMLTRLIEAGVPRPILVSGLIWSVWHWPFILLSAPTNGLPQIVTAGIFLVSITSLGYISAQLRLSTGSLWPSILLHAAWNGIILEIFDALTKHADASVWIGESGIIVACTSALVAFLITRSGRDKPGVVILKHMRTRQSTPYNQSQKAVHE